MVHYKVLCWCFLPLGVRQSVSPKHHINRLHNFNHIKTDHQHSRILIRVTIVIENAHLLRILPLPWLPGETWPEPALALTQKGFQIQACFPFESSIELDLSFETQGDFNIILCSILTPFSLSCSPPSLLKDPPPHPLLDPHQCPPGKCHRPSFP